MDVFNLLIKISLICLLILQIIVLIQMIYTTHKRSKEDEKFYKTLYEKINIDTARYTLDLEKSKESMEDEQVGNQK